MGKQFVVGFRPVCGYRIKIIVVCNYMIIKHRYV
jgi:hypothetical protein